MALSLSPTSIKTLRSMPKREAQQVMARLNAIAAAPADRHPGVTAIQGGPSGRFRVRLGDWRAVFRFVGGDMVVDRGEVYEP